VDEALTAPQHEVSVATVLNEVPLDTLVLKAGLQLQLIDRTLLDARPKLRATFAAKGYMGDDWTRSLWTAGRHWMTS